MNRKAAYATLYQIGPQLLTHKCFKLMCAIHNENQYWHKHKHDFKRLYIWIKFGQDQTNFSFLDHTLINFALAFYMWYHLAIKTDILID